MISVVSGRGAGELELKIAFTGPGDGGESEGWG